jgi:hypothetical protein
MFSSLLWLSCGSEDGLIPISQGVHASLKEKNVPPIWNVDGHAHDPAEWRNNVITHCVGTRSLQRLFR